VLRAQEDLSAALHSFETCVAIRDRLAKIDPANVVWQVDLALGYALLGKLSSAFGDKAKSLRRFKAAREILVPLAERSGNQFWAHHISSIDTEIAALNR
jgi:hypothetical protein